MDKLLRLKKWVRLEEAAHYLSEALGETVTAADVLQLEIEKKIEPKILVAPNAPGGPRIIKQLSNNEILINSACLLRLAGKPALAEKQRTNAMDAEISDILASGTQAKTANVWRELVKRCDPLDGCCLNIEETNSGPVIVWRGTAGNISRLTQKALQRRITRLKPTLKAH